MKIGIATYRELNPLIGGVERISHILATKWKEQGYEVVALCLRRDGRLERVSDFPEYYLPQPDDIAATCNTQYLEQVLRSEKVDILLNQVIVGPCFAEICIRAARSCGAKVISCMHYDIYQHVKDVENSFFIPEKNGLSVKQWGRDILLWMRFVIYRKRQLIREAECIIKQAVEQSDALVLLSRGAVKQCERLVVSNKLHFIPNGIEIRTPKTSLSEKKNRVIFVGRLEYGAKRVDRFIRIWAEVEKNHPRWSAAIVGDGDARAQLEKLSQNLKCKRLFFVGMQNPEPYYSTSSILCMTSSSEGFGMVLVEAMLHGCVPVLFDSFPAASEIVDDGVCGGLVQPYDKKKYEDVLCCLMNDVESIQQMAAAARDKVKYYDIGDIAKQWSDLFNDVLKGESC